MTRIRTRFLTPIFCFICISISFARTWTLPAGFEKLDPTLRKQMLASGSIEKSATDSESFPVLLQTLDPEHVMELGIPMRSVVGNIATASLSRSEIERLIRDPNILRIEFPGVCRPMLDESRPAIRADLVHQGALGRSYRGDGVIVGVYDTGIDWSHPDFIRADGTSRILFIWDQTIEDGPPPSGFDYGTEYACSRIDDEIDGSPSGAVRSRDIFGHGTHVAGIAAGNGRATGNGLPAGRYVGVAPEADLIVVKGHDTGAATDDRIIDGLNYIFQKAGSMERPAVVNLSLGKQQGPHDGSSALETALDSFLWDDIWGDIPGRAIVVAAGDEGNDPIHVLANFDDAVNDSIQIVLRVAENFSASPDYVNVEGWFPPYSNFSVTLLSPGGESFAASPGTIVHEFPAHGGDVYIDHSAYADPANGDKRLFIQIADGTDADFQTGGWTIRLTGGSGRIDLWLYDATVSASVASHVDYSTLLAEPGNARGVITTGSYITRTEWPSLWADPWGDATGNVGERSTFSSAGPTRPNNFDNNPPAKPDITAPGETILSCHSATVTLDPPSDHYIATDGAHRAWAGTSMAAPHVTGLIALLFEANPTLTANQITGILSQSALHDAFTGEGWNPSWGYGKADAFAAMMLTDVQEEPADILPDQFLLTAYPNPFNGSATIVYEVPITSAIPLKLAIFDLSGRLVREWTDLSRQAGIHTVRWDARDETDDPVATGVYLAILRGENWRGRIKLLYLK